MTTSGYEPSRSPERPSKAFGQLSDGVRAANHELLGQPDSPHFLRALGRLGVIADALQDLQDMYDPETRAQDLSSAPECLNGHAAAPGQNGHRDAGPEVREMAASLPATTAVTVLEAMTDVQPASTQDAVDWVAVERDTGMTLVPMSEVTAREPRRTSEQIALNLVEFLESNPLVSYSARELDAVLFGEGHSPSVEERKSVMLKVRAWLQRNPDMAGRVLQTGVRAGTRYRAAPRRTDAANYVTPMDMDDDRVLPVAAEVPKAVVKDSTPVVGWKPTTEWLDGSIDHELLPEGFVPLTQYGIGYVRRREDDLEYNDYYKLDTKLMLSVFARSVLDVFAGHERHQYRMPELLSAVQARRPSISPSDVTKGLKELEALIGDINKGFYNTPLTEDGKTYRYFGLRGFCLPGSKPGAAVGTPMAEGTDTGFLAPSP